MSKTFASKLTVARTRNPNTSTTRNQGTGTIPRVNPSNNRGRSRGMMASGTSSGLGRGSSIGTGRGETTRDPTENLDPQEQQQPDQRMCYQGGYTMISPNEKKRQQIQQQAERGMQSYQQHKEQNRIGQMNYVGTAGGGEVSEQEARKRLIQENRNPSMTLRKKREEYRAQQKKKEEDEINEKRQRQRQLAEKNKLRERQSDADKRNKWDEDRRRKTDEFLRRLEGNTGQTSAESRVPPPHVPSAGQYTPNPTSSISDLPSGGYRQPRGVPSDIETLHGMFPHCDRTVLEDILIQAGSVDNAISMLG